MTRVIFGEALLFLLPFAMFAFYIAMQRRNPLAWAPWNGQVSWLVIAGTTSVIVSLLYTGITADRRQAPFEPTHVEDGRVVPGRFQ
jgi:hypothetical protein